MYGFIYVLCGLLLLDFGPRFSMYFCYGIVTRRVVYHRHNSFLVVARFYFFYIYRCSIFFKNYCSFFILFFSAVFMYKNTAVNKKKINTAVFIILYCRNVFGCLRFEDTKKNEATGTENEHRAHPRSGLGCAWQPLFMGLWAVQAQGRRLKDECMVDGPLEDLVFLNYCNLLVFLGWAKIVVI